MRFSERMDDYLWAQISASTDFKVGNAIRYLRDALGYGVVVSRKRSSDRLRDEVDVILDLRSKKIALLNDLRIVATSEAERLLAVRGFFSELAKVGPAISS